MKDIPPRGAITWETIVAEQQEPLVIPAPWE